MPKENGSKQAVAVVAKPITEMVQTTVESITKEDVKNYFCPLANEKEVFMALGIIKSMNLNPFNREVHLIKYSANDKLSIVVGYEVYIKRAERSGKLDGWKASVDRQAGTAKVVIYRKDWTNPFEWEIKLDEFDKKQSTWKQIPDFMGKKVAIAQAFRLAFPDELAGMPYTEDEHEAFDLDAEEKPKPPIEMPKAIGTETLPPKTEVPPSDIKRAKVTLTRLTSKDKKNLVGVARKRVLMHCINSEGKEVYFGIYDNEALANHVKDSFNDGVPNMEVLYRETADWDNEVINVEASI